MVTAMCSMVIVISMDSNSNDISNGNGNGNGNGDGNGNGNASCPREAQLAVRRAPLVYEQGPACRPLLDLDRVTYHIML